METSGGHSFFFGSKLPQAATSAVVRARLHKRTRRACITRSAAQKQVGRDHVDVSRQHGSKALNSEFGAMVSHVERNKLITWARDQYVSQEMRAGRGVGAAGRKDLKRKYAAMEPVEKASHLQSLDIPAVLQAAAASVVATWAVEPPAVAGEERARAYRGNGTMLRFSGSWSKIADAELEALLHRGGESTVAEVCQALQAHEKACQLWARFKAFFEQLRSRFKIDRYTLAMELHVQVSVEKSCPSVHLHAMFDSRRCLVMERQALVFENACAYISTDAPRARGKATKAAWDQGHYYLQCPKEGQIFVFSTCPCFSVIPVKPEWVTQLWQLQKLSTENASREYLKCRKHVKQYLDNVSFCQRAEEESQIRVRKAQAAASLEPLMRKAVTLPLVQETWLPQYEKPMFRRRFLVLSGPSQLGKTLFAQSLCPSGTCFELNCAGSTDLDLRAYSPVRHSLILFDEASPQLVLQRKKLFQGGLEEITMGQSQTSCYSYKVWVHGIKMVLTSNRWTEDLAALCAEDRAWIEQNQVFIQCDSPLYEA